MKITKQRRFKKNNLKSSEHQHGLIWKTFKATKFPSWEEKINLQVSFISALKQHHVSRVFHGIFMPLIVGKLF
jgi:hypothetical protein